MVPTPEGSATYQWYHRLLSKLERPGLKGTLALQIIPTCFSVQLCFFLDIYICVCVCVCVCVLPACILHTMCMPGAHAEDEPPCGCWELNLGPLQEQQMLLTAELTLQPLPCSSVFGERKSQLETLHVLTYF